MFIRREIVAAAVAAIVTVAAALAFPVRAQQPPPTSQKEKEKEEEKPAVVSADALKLGAQIESAASADALKWARDYARREITGRPAAPEAEAVAKAVAARYPNAPAAAHEAGAYLAWYLAYQHATKSQEIAAMRVRDMDRDIRYLEDDLLRIRNTPVPIAQMAAARIAEDRAEARLQDAGRQRSFSKRILDNIRARVDLCLERLAAQYEGLKDRDPAEVRALN